MGKRLATLTGQFILVIVDTLIIVTQVLDNYQLRIVYFQVGFAMSG